MTNPIVPQNPNVLKRTVAIIRISSHAPIVKNVCGEMLFISILVYLSTILSLFFLNLFTHIFSLSKRLPRRGLIRTVKAQVYSTFSPVAFAMNKLKLFRADGNAGSLG